MWGPNWTWNYWSWFFFYGTVLSRSKPQPLFMGQKEQKGWSWIRTRTLLCVSTAGSKDTILFTCTSALHESVSWEGKWKKRWWSEEMADCDLRKAHLAAGITGRGWTCWFPGKLNSFKGPKSSMFVWLYLYSSLDVGKHLCVWDSFLVPGKQEDPILMQHDSSQEVVVGGCLFISWQPRPETIAKELY